MATAETNYKIGQFEVNPFSNARVTAGELRAMLEGVPDHVKLDVSVFEMSGMPIKGPRPYYLLTLSGKETK